MKTTIRVLLLVMSLGGTMKGDSLQISLAPASGVLSVAPGQMSGWGFSLDWTSTSDWVTITGSALTEESNSSLVTYYTDFIGVQGGPTDWALAPNTIWTEATFNPTSQTGVGAISVSESAAIFAQDSGTLTVFYEIYSGDPTNGGTLLSTSSASTPFMVQVAGTQSAPEPQTVGLFALGLVSIFVARRRLRYR
jgi:hypothetical protein